MVIESGRCEVDMEEKFNVLFQFTSSRGRGIKVADWVT